MNAVAAAVSPSGRIKAILDSLIDERRRLRADPHDESLLAANRIAIVYWREQLEQNDAGGIARVQADPEA